MKNKLVYAGIGIILMMVVGSIILSFGILNKNSNTITGNIIDDSQNRELGKYRSENIPEDCRLPEYEDDVESWKEHLSHHKETWYCLDYYGTSIEELNRGK